MINLIIGPKGSGKTKRLVDMVNNTAKISKGNVVCIEKGDTLKFSANPSVKLCNINDYNIKGYDSYYGFLTGICASNYDITDIFCDATFRIVGEKDFERIAVFLKKVSDLSQKTNTRFLLTLSCNEKDILSKVFTFARKI